MTTNPLVALGALGQSPWYDFITRDLVVSGELARLIADDGLRGMTTNPTIFEKAVAGSDLYDEDIRRLTAEGRRPDEIFESLAVEDVRAACDLFQTVHRQSRGMDGLVSVEVSPTLAHDTSGTIAEAARLWGRIGRPNVMIKIPGTREGLPAITRCLAQGINVNVTLLFAVSRYREVADAFFAGLDQRLAAGQPVAGVASVASFFVSRLDAKIPGFKAAIANAAMAYAAFEEVFASARWRALAAKGALVQRPLWASTSSKDPSLPDVYYVEALIAERTVNTMPPATFAAYRDHGRPAIRIREQIEQARPFLAGLAKQGVDLEAITRTLESEGVKAFAASFQSLLSVIEKKAAVLV
ncbi:MAG TPA: transaldolase [Gemmatimonadales bacterium]|jgi:transaldolase